MSKVKPLIRRKQKTNLKPIKCGLVKVVKREDYTIQGWFVHILNQSNLEDIISMLKK